MPPDHRLRFHNDQNIRPSRPYVPQGGPEEAVETVQRRSWPLSFEHGDLLSKSENFQGGIHTTTEEDADGSQKCCDRMEHESTVVTRGNALTYDPRPDRNLLISVPQNLLPTDSRWQSAHRRQPLCAPFRPGRTTSRRVLSLTMYNAQSFLVDNPINRYNIAGWMPLKQNPDGSLDVYIQRDSPAKTRNRIGYPIQRREYAQRRLHRFQRHEYRSEQPTRDGLLSGICRQPIYTGGAV